MVGVAPSSRISPELNTSPMTVSVRPKTSDIRKALEPKRSAASRSCLPSARETELPQPTPIMKPTAWISAIIAKTIPTAPAALVPSLATKKVSTIL